MLQAELTKYADQLLTEIIENRNKNGSVDLGYWSDKFSQFSMEEDSFCRSCFKELSDADFVKVIWADGVPYNMTITSKGISYYELPVYYK